MDIKLERGQSSVELLVSAAVLVPIILLLPTLANFLLAQTEAHKAARYVAWERTVYPEDQLKSGEQLAAEVEDRFYRYAQSGFSGESPVQNVPWRDWGSPNPNDQARSIIDYDRSVSASVDTSRSPTEHFRNSSSWLAGRGGQNAVSLDTLQSASLVVPVRSDSSLFQSMVGNVPVDPVTGEPGYVFRSASAIVSDSWVPGNEQVFKDRVGDIGGGIRSFTRWYENNPLTHFASGWFREIPDHLFVDTPDVHSSFDMVNPEQSQILPADLKIYSP